MKNLTIVANPFIKDALTRLRNEKTDTKTFRLYADTLSYVLLSTVLGEEDLNDVKVQTPLVETKGMILNNDFIVVVILRAGIAMLQPTTQLLPTAKVGFAGVFRDEKTATPHEYYWKMPTINSTSTVIVIDPMLATGGTMVHVLSKIKDYKPKEIRVVSIVSAPEGISVVQKAFPEVKIFTASVDSYLNAKKYIVPGLGDFGDRYFGTHA